jgi:hypothetical protein
MTSAHHSREASDAHLPLEICMLPGEGWSLRAAAAASCGRRGGTRCRSSTGLRRARPQPRQARGHLRHEVIKPDSPRHRATRRRATHREPVIRLPPADGSLSRTHLAVLGEKPTGTAGSRPKREGGLLSLFAGALRSGRRALSPPLGASRPPSTAATSHRAPAAAACVPVLRSGANDHPLRTRCADQPWKVHHRRLSSCEPNETMRQQIW